VKSDKKVVDTSFYTKELLTLLLEDSSGDQTLIQLPISSLNQYFPPPCTTNNLNSLSPLSMSTTLSSIPTIHLSDIPGLRSRCMDSLSARQLAVSGPRKVSVFLFRNKKRLRIYDMEGEEEEEDETLESSGFSASGEFTSSQMC